MKQYTERIHATRLLGMLNKKDPCICCPQDKYYDAQCFHGYMPWQKNGDEGESACKICMSFIGVMPNESKWCPCNILGRTEAIKLTWLALEAKGYLE